MSTITPTIVAKSGRAVFVTGGAGGASIPGPVAVSVSNRVDYGMDPAHALDVARVVSFCMTQCRGLETSPPGGGTAVEDGRVRQDVLDELAARGHPLGYLGEYGGVFPNLQAVGTDLATGMHVGASDPREDRGVTASSLLPSATGRRSCLSHRSPIRRRHIGRVLLGVARTGLSRLPLPVRKAGRSTSWCVDRSSGRVTAVFSPRGVTRLIVTTASKHGNRGVHPGARVRSLRAYPNRIRLGHALYEAYPKSREVIGVGHGRVRFLAVADRGLLRHPRKLRRYLRLAGL